MSSRYTVTADRRNHRLSRTATRLCAGPVPFEKTKTADPTSDPVCPSCSEGFVKRINCRGIAERLISLRHIYPFRCQLCGNRFRYQQTTVGYLVPTNNRREYSRIRTSFPVWISAANIDAKGSVVDISMAGCTLSSDAKLTPGALLTLELKTARERVPVVVTGVLVRNVRMKNAGVEFGKFQQNGRERLQCFMRGLLLDASNLQTEDHRPSKLYDWGG